MARQKFPSDLTERLILRMPAGLRDEIKTRAQQHLRSTSAQAVWMLQQMLEREKETAPEGAGTPAEA